MSTEFESAKIFNRSKDLLFDKSKLTLEECRFKIYIEDNEKGILLAKAGTKFTSEQNIMIMIDEDGKVSMKSECAYAFKLYDWGKNKRNVERFFEKLWLKC